MKPIVALMMVVFFCLNVSGQENAKTKLEIYYFHATHRCPTCISIEENTTNLLNTNFKKEVDAGEIKLHVLDYEETANKDLVEKYGAYGSTLILQSNTDKTKMEDLTNFAFQYSKATPDKFKTGLKEKIEQMLK